MNEVVQVTARDLNLFKQKYQKRYVKLRVLNREMTSIGVINGQIISGSINIDTTSQLRRSASLSMHYYPASDDTVSILSIDYYIAIDLGIEDNATLEMAWYPQGIFIINQSGIKVDSTTRTIDLSLSDLMAELTGDRCGVLHAYTSIVKNSQKINNVIRNVLSLVGISTYALDDIQVLRAISTVYDENETQDDYNIPYDMDFSVGVTAYDILDKCVKLYPYYVMYFDVYGTFRVDRVLPDEYDDSFVYVDYSNMHDFVISEDTSNDYFAVKNHIEVWGKDGNYYGEASDLNPESPFNAQAAKPMTMVCSGTDSETGLDCNSICDRYKDNKEADKILRKIENTEAVIIRLSATEEPTEEQQKELAAARESLQELEDELQKNVSLSGDELAAQWAERILSLKSRLNDTITLETILLPFFNDVDFKFSYMLHSNGEIRTYTVKSVSHDLGSNRTTITGARFYNDQMYMYRDQLDEPTILTVGSGVTDMTITLNVTPVSNAQQYVVLIDGLAAFVAETLPIVYTLPDKYAGEHKIRVYAAAQGYRDSDKSNTVKYEFKPAKPANFALITENENDYIVTDNDNYIITI